MVQHYLARPTTAYASYVLLLFLIFSNFCQTNLNIYRTDLREIFRVGRTVAVDDQSEISFFRSLKGGCHGNTATNLGVIHTLGSGDIQQMALTYGKSSSA